MASKQNLAFYGREKGLRPNKPLECLLYKSTVSDYIHDYVEEEEECSTPNLIPRSDQNNAMALKSLPIMAAKTIGKTVGDMNIAFPAISPTFEMRCRCSVITVAASAIRQICESGAFTQENQRRTSVPMKRAGKMASRNWPNNGQYWIRRGFCGDVAESFFCDRCSDEEDEDDGE